MAFTASSTVGQVLAVKPGAIATVEQYIGRRISPTEIEFAQGMTLKNVAEFVSMSQEKLEALIKELNT
jgi:uncharacterized membrane protein